MERVIRQFLIVVVLAPSVVLGYEVIVPLPGLTGHYVDGGPSKSANIDCGIQFSEIQNVKIVCDGHHIDGVLSELGTGKTISYNGVLTFRMSADSGYWSASPEVPGERYFTKSPVSSATWDFLLDGQADISAIMNAIILGIYSVIDDASGYISEAHLVIEGTPEPIDAIELLKPNTRQYLLSGSTYRIEWFDWRYYDSCSGDFQISYSLDDGISWIAITATPVSNVCHYDWQVPAVMSENCLIKVEEINSSLTDTSDVPFSIYECAVSPLGDLTGDCFVNLKDFQIISDAWLDTGGYTMADLVVLAENWLGCRNPYNPACGL